jgi:hypothetical protein
MVQNIYSYQEKGVEFLSIPVPHSCKTVVWVMLLLALSLESCCHAFVLGGMCSILILNDSVLEWLL